MIRLLLALSVALCLTACGTPTTTGGIVSSSGNPPPGGGHPIVTPARCAATLSGITTASQATDFLVSMGLPAADAQAASVLLIIGKVAVTAICAKVTHTTELPPPPPGQ